MRCIIYLTPSIHLRTNCIVLTYISHTIYRSRTNNIVLSFVIIVHRYPVVLEKPPAESFSIQEEASKLCEIACKKGFADPDTDLFTITAGLPFGTVGVSK